LTINKKKILLLLITLTGNKLYLFLNIINMALNLEDGKFVESGTQYVGWEKTTEQKLLDLFTVDDIEYMEKLKEFMNKYDIKDISYGLNLFNVYKDFKRNSKNKEKAFEEYKKDLEKFMKEKGITDVRKGIYLFDITNIFNKL